MGTRRLTWVDWTLCMIPFFGPALLVLVVDWKQRWNKT